MILPAVSKHRDYSILYALVCETIVFCSQPKLFIKAKTKTGRLKESIVNKMDEMASGRAENWDTKPEVFLEVYDAYDI